MLQGKGQVAGTCGYGEGLSGSINEIYWLASKEGLCSMELQGEEGKIDNS